MRYVVIAAAVLLPVLLFFFCKIRIKLLYRTENNTTLVKIWWITVFAHPAAKKKPERKPAPEKKSQMMLNPEMEIKQLFDLLADIFGELRTCLKKICFEYFSLTLAVGTHDAALTAKLCGYAWAAYGTFWARLKSMASIKRENIDIYCDFNAPHMTGEVVAVLSVTPYKVCAIGLRFAKLWKRIKANDTVFTAQG